MISSAPLFISSHVHAGHSDALTFVFRNNELLVSEADNSLPDLRTCASLTLDESRIQALGFFAGRHCRTTWVDAETQAPAGFHFVRLRALLSAAADDVMSVAGRASQIAEWARTHRFCGVCGTPMRMMDSERCARCPGCGASTYPRISPAMMVLITRGDQALLARHAASTNQVFSALAGFVEAGESVEETVHREVMEEVGLKVHKLQYFGSQPWPFPHSLMIAFKAEYLSGEIRLDENEIAEARWFARDEVLPEVASTISISGHLIRSHFTKLA